jgi:chromosome segregation ATPase
VGKTLDDVFHELSRMNELLDRKFGDIDQKFVEIDKRFDAIDSKFDGIDKRFNGINKKLDDIDKRLDGIDKRLDEHDRKFKSIEEAVASMMEMQGKCNAFIGEINQRLDTLELIMRRTNENFIFLDKKVWKNEREIFILAKQIGVDLEMEKKLE